MPCSVAVSPRHSYIDVLGNPLLIPLSRVSLVCIFSTPPVTSQCTYSVILRTICPIPIPCPCYSFFVCCAGDARPADGSAAAALLRGCCRGVELQPSGRTAAHRAATAQQSDKAARKRAWGPALRQDAAGRPADGRR